MRFESKLNGSSGTIIASALAFFILTAGASEAHAKIFRTSVTGLPSGLVVQFVGQWSCYLDNRSAILEEEQYTDYEYSIVFGRPQIRLVTRTRYVGQIDKIRQANVNCGIENAVSLNETDFDANYIVWGTDNGLIRVKIDTVHYEVTPDANVQENLSEHVEAKTTALTAGSGTATPTTVTKNQMLFTTWRATYSDSFGFQDIRLPALDFTQPVVNQLGLVTNQSRVKMWITDNDEVCLRVTGDTVCKARSEGGNLSNRNVVVAVGDITIQGTQTSDGNGNEETVTWRFRFNLLGTVFTPAIPSGDYNVIVSADDRDLEEYSQGSGATNPPPSSILPWKSLTVPIVVQ